MLRLPVNLWSAYEDGVQQEDGSVDDHQRSGSKSFVLVFFSRNKSGIMPFIDDESPGCYEHDTAYNGDDSSQLLIDIGVNDVS